MRLIKLIFFIFLFSFSTFSFAQSPRPVILVFDSTIQVHQNSDLTVTENIIVRSYGRIIKRGIYRDFPTKYKSKSGLNYHIGFKMLGAEIDGKSSPYHLASRSNGVRIYVGDKNKQVGAGVHTYTISYHVNRELGYFKTHDELYWNVTGTGWRFPIEKAVALVQLPPGASDAMTGAKAYTGRYGQRGTDYTIHKNVNGDIIFVTTRPLAKHEGFTIVLGWKKGFVHEPTQWEKLQYIIKDNQSLIILLSGLLIVFLYYLFIWNKVGKDPKRGVVIPLFEPPEGMSPAGLRYVMDMGYDNKVLTAAVVDMAVRGYLKIEQKEDEKYVLHKVGNESVLTAPQKALANEFFLNGKTVFELDKDNAKMMQSAIKDFRAKLQNEFVGQFFVLNTKYLYMGLVLSILCISPVFLIQGAGMLIFIIPFILIFGFAGLFTALKTKSISARNVLGANIFSMVFVAIWLFIMFKDSGLPIISIVLILAYVVLNGVFYFLLKRPTERGTHVINKAHGFKMFLEATEKDRMNFRNPPEKTPELFEKYLPYAMALDVDQEWCEQFADVFARMRNQGGYQPNWLMGIAYANFSMASFGSDISSSLNSAIASASSPPGSSSGFSGGGGVGGGGGGGGGW